MVKRGNGEGPIYRRRNGTWAAQYTVWTAEGRRRRSVSGKTRAEVSRKLTRAMADRDGGLVCDAGKLTVGEHIDRCLADSVKGTVKEDAGPRLYNDHTQHLLPRPAGHAGPRRRGDGSGAGNCDAVS